MKSNFEKEEIRNKLQSLKRTKTESQLIERDSMILQANYLSEIERLYQNIGLNRKDLAVKIGTSPSYLSQVFCGDKPLNFLTLAKIKRALDLRFDLTASFAFEKETEIQNESVPDFQPQMKMVYFAYPEPNTPFLKEADYVFQNNFIERTVTHVIEYKEA